MEFRQLEYFMALCKELHFTRASEQLGVTQPTLSHQIKALEIEMGMPLFDRIGKKTTLTSAGQVLFKHGTHIFQSIQSAMEEMRELQEVKSGKLSIGVLTGELTQFVSPLLLTFHKKYPNIQITVIGKDDVVDAIIDNELEIALTIVPIHDKRLTIVPLYEENLYLTVSHRHPLANKKTIDLEQVKNEPFIIFPKNYQCRQQIEAAFKFIKAPLNPMIETDAAETIMSLVQAEAGISILSKTLLHMWGNDQIRMIEIMNPPIRRQIGLVYHKEKFIGYAAQQFIYLLQQSIAKHGLSSTNSPGY
ncbi:LysR family transcriptional regulator [Paenibacillus sp. J5C_2022]|uniref:LysR family transcriptional regulator n=1 Tax=Paenibacillus sp. J5C2022 TaxID=2977129 RepID=UPI0021D053D4|nr:LysR family transcriptional regulator [Paenibacillus sp. J5C2022]MCU6710187.1 LysR family transcriptional regulator [Paenibacillus sp. J5C2022]